MFASKLTRSKTNTAVKQTNQSAVPKPTSRMQGGNRQEDSERANLAVSRANPHLSWDFTKIPAFPPRSKLAIGRVDDPLEHEADWIAADLMRTSVSATPHISSDFAARATGGTLRLSKAMALTGPIVTETPGLVHEVLRTPGKPLDEATRAFFEPHFGHDFSRVRVHTDAAAAESAHDLDARAYTVGHKIVFGAGRFAPEAIEGRRLIAHELAHVVQQAGSPQAPILMRAPNDQKPPVPKPGQTPFNFISESPALPNWKESVKGMLEREFNKKFNTFEEAQEHFRQYLRNLPSDSEREAYADRMRDRARKAFYRREANNPSYNYSPEEQARLKKGASPASDLQLEHMEDVKTKQRGGQLIKGQPERALDPGNIYTTEGGPGGTAPRGTKHAEKYRTIEASKKASQDIRDKATQTVSEGDQPAPKAATTEPARPVTPAPTTEPPASTAEAARTTKASAPPSPGASEAAEAAPEAPAARRTNVNVEIEAGSVRVNVEGGWKWAGRVGTGATVALQIYGAIEMIDSAVAQIQKAQTGSVRPEIAKAMAAVEANFSSANSTWTEKFHSWHEDVNYPAARDWLINNGFQALLQKGTLLETMGDYLNTVYWYNQYLDDLEHDYNTLQNRLNPIYEEVQKRTRALYDISDAVLKVIPKFPNDTAQAQLFGIYQTFYDAAGDMSRLEGQISARTSEYKQWKDKAHAGRIEAARWLNYWAPGYQKVTGKKILTTHVSE